MDWLNHRERPVVCATSMWIGKIILIAVLACPIPVLIGFLYYRLFDLFDRRLRAVP